jgi:hypothetical protein
VCVGSGDGATARTAVVVAEAVREGELERADDEARIQRVAQYEPHLGRDRGDRGGLRVAGRGTALRSDAAEPRALAPTASTRAATGSRTRDGLGASPQPPRERRGPRAAYEKRRAPRRGK